MESTDTLSVVETSISHCGRVRVSGGAAPRVLQGCRHGREADDLLSPGEQASDTALPRRPPWTRCERLTCAVPHACSGRWVSRKGVSWAGGVAVIEGCVCAGGGVDPRLGLLRPPRWL